MYLINCGSKIIDLSNDISNMAGYVHRSVMKGYKPILELRKKGMQFVMRE